MRTQTRLAAAFATALLVLILLACGGTQSEDQDTTGPTATLVTESTPEPGTTVPGTTEPGITEPGTTVPGTTVPSREEPGASNTQAPGTQSPDPTTPGLTGTETTKSTPDAPRTEPRVPLATPAPWNPSAEDADRSVQSHQAAPNAAALTSVQSESRGHRPPPPRRHGPRPRLGSPRDTEFADNPRQPFVSTSDDAVSTFALDTDRASYRLALAWAQQGHPIDPDSVRAEEWLNALDHGYAKPAEGAAFAVTTGAHRHPLDTSLSIVSIGLQAADTPRTRPVNLTLVLDGSGSMAEGARVETAREIAYATLGSLREDAQVAVVHFDDHVKEGLTRPHGTPEAAMRSVNRLAPGGATNVQAGLNRGLELAAAARRARPGAVNYVMLLSDGVANVDATNPFAILDTSGQHNEQNPIRLITIGVGISNYNDHLLETLAQYGNGWYRYVDTPAEAQRMLGEGRWTKLSTPHADAARVQVIFDPRAVVRWRLIGYENRAAADEDFTQARREFAELHSGAAVTALYEIEPTGASTSLGEMELRWTDPTTREEHTLRSPVTGEPLLPFRSAPAIARLAATVGLAADAYSALEFAVPVDRPYTAPWREAPDNRTPAGQHLGLAALSTELHELREELGDRQSHRDLTALLEHMLRYAPSQGAQKSGYSD